MSESLLSKKTKALYNNTFSMESTETTNIYAVEHSYNYLSRIQKALVNNKVPIRIDGEYAVGYNDKLDVYINVNHNLIHPADQHKYRLSKFYDNYITFEDIISNPDIFRYIPIPIVNGSIVKDFKVRTTLPEEYEIILDIDKIFLKSQYTIDVYMFENVCCNIVHTTVPVLRQKSFSIMIENLKNLIPDGMNGLFFSFINNSKSIYGTNIIECDADFLITNKIDFSNYITDNITSFLNQSSDIDITYFFVPYLYRGESFNKDNPYLVIDGNLPMPVPEENLLIVAHDESGSYLHLPDIKKHSYPNIYEFNCEDNVEYQSYYYYREDAEKVRSYNNKFKYFFDYLEMKYGSVSTSMIFNNIINGTITITPSKAISEYIDKIISYVDPEYEYSNRNFDELKLSEFEYKTSKLHNFIDFEPWILRDYIIDQNKVGYRRYMYAKDIDLKSRLRLDTKKEAVLEQDILTFDEPRYVFQFRNDYPRILHIRFYVDGIICPVPHSVLCEGVEYYYVPASMFTEDSIIEVERLDQYRYHDKMKFELDSDGNYSQTITFPKFNNAKPTIFDIYFTDSNDRRLTFSAFRIQPVFKNIGIEVDVENNTLILRNLDSFTGTIITDPDEMKYKVNNSILYFANSDFSTNENSLVYGDSIKIDKIVLDNSIKSNTNDSGYKDNIYIYAENGKQYKFTDAEFIVDGIGNVLHYFKSYLFLEENPIKITLNGDYYKDKDVHINVNKLSRGFNFFIQVDGPPQCIVWEKNVLNRRRKEYIRVFLNGRLLEPDAYIFHYMRKTGQDRISLKKSCKKGDIVSIDMNVFSYNIEYKMPEIPDDYIVDVNHMLDKPLDLNYYDIYLNGRKLNSTNVTILTPTKMMLTGVHSRKNLLIISKDRDPEYYGYDKEKGCTTEADIILDSVIDKNDRKELSKHIVNEVNSDASYYIDDTDDTEEDIYADVVYNERDYNRWAFYWNDLCQIGHINPDLVQFNKERIKEFYQYMFTEYTARAKKRIRRRIIHTNPDICYTAPVALKVGDIRKPEYLI